MPVTGFTLVDASTLEWIQSPTAVSYTVFRDIATGGTAPQTGCIPLQLLTSVPQPALPSDPVQAIDPGVPPAGSIFYYVVQPVDGTGATGTLGDGSCAERTAADPVDCPG